MASKVRLSHVFKIEKWLLPKQENSECSWFTRVWEAKLTLSTKVDICNELFHHYRGRRRCTERSSAQELGNGRCEDQGKC